MGIPDRQHRLVVLATLISWLLVPIFGTIAATGIPIIAWIGGALVFFTAFILLFFQFFYFGWLWSRGGQSYGMKFLGIKVMRRDGAPLGFWRAGFRGTIGYWISGLVFGLGFIWAAFDRNKEAWHDKLFDTHVLKL
ncbi:MAG: RDD family protein [Anaerolineales bacterium]|nr:RDD family protein [Anaerolineales bacterium]